MHLEDLLAIVPLITLVYFLLGLKGLFKRKLHIHVFVGLSIVNGIINSFTTNTAFVICFDLVIATIVVTGLIGSVYLWIREHRR